MSGIDWNRAPSWAQWAAMDESGAWYWYAARPTCAQSLGMFSAASQRMEPAKFPGWENSAQPRPVEPPKAAPRERVGGSHPVRLIGAASGWKVDQMLDVGWTYDGLVARGHAEWIA